MSRMSRLLSGALPPPPPVLTRLVRNRALSQKLVVAPSCTVFSSKVSVKGRDGRFFLLVCGSDQLVGSQIARLSGQQPYRAQSAAGLVCTWRHSSCGDDSAAGFVHCITSSGKMSASERCCFLRGAQQQHESSVFRALCQQSLCVSASAGGLCVLMAHRSGSVLRCSLSTFRYT